MGAQVGLIGLAVMGQNLALNIERNGFPIAVFNRTGARTKDFIDGPAAGRKFTGAYTLEELVAAIDRPRKIILMVQAGTAVDEQIAKLKPLVQRAIDRESMNGAKISVDIADNLSVLAEPELLARALAAALDGAHEHEALAAYQSTRDGLSVPLFEVADTIASHRWNDAEIGGLLLRLSSSMADEVELLAGLDHRGPSAPSTRHVA